MSNVQGENEKLKSTMREMVDDYTRQLELRDDNIKSLENFNQKAMIQEIDNLNHENRILKEKCGKINREVEHISSECDRLKRNLIDKDRQIDA